MPTATVSKFVEGLLRCPLLDDPQRAEVRRLRETMEEPRHLAQELLRRDWLTAYQINQIIAGKGDELTMGPYVLLARIGEGGMGQVFKARQKLLNRVVALKVIRKECLKNPKVVMRFQREIRAAGKLSHPHIVRAYDADQLNGTYYIAMEYIDGTDLNQMVREEGPLRVDRACEYIRQAALGLQHAYERGLVHRDLKPANLLVTRAVSHDRRRSSGLIRRPPLRLEERKKNRPPTPDAATLYPWGIVKILDMGLARLNDDFLGRPSTQLTHVGSIMGTPEYIAPEQARDSHTSDVRSDLYSLGCTLFFLLTGLPPFPNGTLTEKLMQHQFNEPPALEPIRRERLLAWAGVLDDALAAVPERVEAVIRKLLAKEPDDRFKTPIDLANELHSILDELQAEVRERKPGTRGPNSRPVVKLKPQEPTVIMPIVYLTPPSLCKPRWLGKAAIALAAVGGLGALGTAFAGLLLRWL